MLRQQAASLPCLEAFLEKVKSGSLDQGRLAISVCNAPPSKGAASAASPAVPGAAQSLQLPAQDRPAAVEGAHHLSGVFCRYYLKNLVPVWPAVQQLNYQVSQMNVLHRNKADWHGAKRHHLHRPQTGHVLLQGQASRCHCAACHNDKYVAH